ncbi:MAG: recombinase family protein, partial [bacterium]
MEVEELKTGYVLYARKSSEAEERQALSIDSQVKETLEFARQQGLNVLEVKQESHSAKETGKRPVFNEMLAEVRSGKFQGIVTWAPDRLSRNAGDLGAIVDLMDTKLLHSIRTPSQKFTDSPSDKFLLMILCSHCE